MTSAPKTCVVMQPTYLPWSGYFNLMAEADVFIFHDNVQIEKQSWQNRNRILSNGQDTMLSVPCQRQGADQLILDVVLEERPGQQNWRRKHVRMLQEAYRKHPHFDIVESVIDLLQADDASNKLANLNIRLIRYFAEGLALQPEFAVASELPVSGQRSEKLVNFCRYFECDRYLSPVGSADYLAADGDFERSPIKLDFQTYQPEPYPQLKAPNFVSHLSIVDVLANVGWENARQYVTTGSIEPAVTR